MTTRLVTTPPSGGAVVADWIPVQYDETSQFSESGEVHVVVWVMDSSPSGESGFLGSVEWVVAADGQSLTTPEPAAQRGVRYIRVGGYHTTDVGQIGNKHRTEPSVAMSAGAVAVAGRARSRACRVSVTASRRGARRRAGSARSRPTPPRRRSGWRR